MVHVSTSTFGIFVSFYARNNNTTSWESSRSKKITINMKIRADPKSNLVITSAHFGELIARCLSRLDLAFHTCIRVRVSRSIINNNNNNNINDDDR